MDMEKEFARQHALAERITRQLRKFGLVVSDQEVALELCADSRRLRCAAIALEGALEIIDNVEDEVLEPADP